MKNFFITLLLLIFVCSVRYEDPWIIQSIRLKALDLHQRNQDEVLIDTIVTIGLDNKSLRKFGQWPWPRDLLAQQLVKVFEAGASMVVLPVLFSQPDRFGTDNSFVDLLQQVPIVVGQIPADELQGNPVPRGVVSIGGDWKPWLYEYATAIGPIASIGKTASGVGMMNAPPEPDGVVRRMSLVVQINGEMYPSIALETIRVAAGESSYQVKAGAGGIEAIRVPGYGKVITDPHASIWVNFRYRTKVYSLVDNLPDLLGAVVILSPTASGINNPVATPVGVIEGHDLIATTVATMINGDIISRPYWANFAEISAVAVLGIICIILVMYSSWYISMFFPIIICSIYFISAWAFKEHRYMLDWSFPMIGLSIIWSVLSFLKFVEEFRKRMLIKKQFEHYLAPAMVKKLQRNPELLKLGGETREITILFCDIRGFTPISEKYKNNPQGLTLLINEFLTPMTTIIMNNGGTIDKYIGDCIMAFWNAPLDIDQQRLKALQSTHEMSRQLKLLNDSLKNRDLDPLDIGIGINTGEAVVGNMGSDQRFDYSCLGDAVNLAARLEGQSKSYGVRLVIGESSVFNVAPYYFLLELDLIAVKGKSEGVRIFTSLGDIVGSGVSVVWRQDKLKHQLFLNQYRRQEWEEAIDTCQSMLHSFDGIMTEYYKIMLIRMEDLKIVGLPPNWDGVYVATTK